MRNDCQCQVQKMVMKNSKTDIEKNDSEYQTGKNSSGDQTYACLCFFIFIN